MTPGTTTTTTPTLLGSWGAGRADGGAVVVLARMGVKGERVDFVETVRVIKDGLCGG